MMKNYKIGIVDDDSTHVMDIQRIFKRYGKINKLSFEFFSFYMNDNDDYNKIVASILNALNESTIDCLIIDYKLIFSHEAIKGADILNIVRGTISEFPCIILTGKADECLNDAKIDPDKIYVKSEFLKISQDVSNIMVNKILLNIDICRKKKETLIQELNNLKKQMVDQNSDTNKIIEKIIAVEAELDKYCMVGQSELDKIYDSSSLEKVVELLERARNLKD